MSVTFEVIDHPISGLYIVLLVWVWVNVVVEDWDCKPFILSYEDCVVKKQYWRLLTSPLIHKSFVHLFLNLVTLWSVRWIEDEYGSWFMLRYTILLHALEGIFAFAIIKYGIKVAQSDLLRQYLRNIQSFGSSGVAIAWLTFMSTHLHTAPIVFLGVLPLHAAYALFPTILLSYLFTPLSNAYANLSGLWCGYMLAAGLLTVLPTPYLTTCILGNIFVVALVSYYQHIYNPDEVVAASSAEEDGEGDMIEVWLLGPPSDTLRSVPVPNNNSSEGTRQVPLSAAAESLADTVRQRFGTWFRPRGEGARGAEEATPLLQEEADSV